MAQHPGGSRIGDTEDGPLVGAARSAEQAVHRLAEQGQKNVGAAIDTSREYVRENPLRSVLLAVGVGALVGYMVGRRR